MGLHGRLYFRGWQPNTCVKYQFENQDTCVGYECENQFESVAQGYLLEVGFPAAVDGKGPPPPSSSGEQLCLLGRPPRLLVGRHRLSAQGAGCHCWRHCCSIARFLLLRALAACWKCLWVWWVGSSSTWGRPEWPLDTSISIVSHCTARHASAHRASIPQIILEARSRRCHRRWVLVFWRRLERRNKKRRRLLCFVQTLAIYVERKGCVCLGGALSAHPPLAETERWYLHRKLLTTMIPCKYMGDALETAARPWAPVLGRMLLVVLRL